MNCPTCGSPRVKKVDLSKVKKFSLPYEIDKNKTVLQCQNPSCHYDWNGELE